MNYLFVNHIDMYLSSGLKSKIKVSAGQIYFFIKVSLPPSKSATKCQMKSECDAVWGSIKPHWSRL